MQDIRPPHRGTPRTRSTGSIEYSRRDAAHAASRLITAQPSFQPQSILTIDSIRRPVPLPTALQVPDYDALFVEALPAAQGITALTMPTMTKAAGRAHAAQEKVTHALKRLISRQSLLIGLAVVIASMSLYLGFNSWVASRKVAPNMQLEKTAPLGTRSDEGSDESMPSLASYSVAIDMPRALYIDKLDVAARIMPVGVNEKSAIKSPKNIYDAGWYTASSRPGEDGAMFIDGHATGPTKPGIFADLDKLVKGDRIKIENGDGKIIEYEVVATETADVSSVTTNKLLSPHDDATEGLNIMTYTGNWISAEQTYDQRVIVYTERV